MTASPGARPHRATRKRREALIALIQQGTARV